MQIQLDNFQSQTTLPGNITISVITRAVATSYTNNFPGRGYPGQKRNKKYRFSREQLLIKYVETYLFLFVCFYIFEIL